MDSAGVLCVICIMRHCFIMILYHPPAEPGTGGGLKIPLPGGISSGRGLSTQKEEQAGRELECLPLTFAPSRVSIRMFGAGLRSRRWHRLSGMQSSPEEPEYYLRGITRETTTSMEVCSSRQTVFWENRESDHLRSQHEQRGNVRESGSVRLL